MGELKRIALDKRLIAVVVCCLIINGLLFVSQQLSNHPYGLNYQEMLAFEKDYHAKMEGLSLKSAYERQAALDGLKAADSPLFLPLSEQVNYVNGYHTYIQNVLKQSKQIQRFSFIQNTSAFEKRNIELTATQFESLLNVKPRLGSDHAIEAFAQFQMKDWLIVIMIVYICTLFWDERKAGLWQIIHSLKHGRVRLGFFRIGLLFLFCALLTFLIYGSTFFLSEMIYGASSDTGRPIQSISIFQTLTLLLSINGWVAVYLFARIVTAVLIGLGFMAILTVIKDTKLALLLLGLLLAAEYALTFIPAQSSLVFLKVINFFNFLNVSDGFFVYFNVNVFGLPVNQRAIMVGILMVGFVIFSLIYVVRYAHDAMEKSKRAGFQGSLWFGKVRDGLIRKNRLLGYELYKCLFLQKGIWLLIILCAIISVFPFFSTKFYDDSTYAIMQLTGRFQGILSEDSKAQMEAYSLALDDGILQYSLQRDAYQKGEVSEGEFGLSTLQMQQTLKDRAAFLTLQNRIDALTKIESAAHQTQWLIDQTPFREVYGFLEIDFGKLDRQTHQKQLLTALLVLSMLTLLISGLDAYDHQTHMDILQRTLYFRRKQGWAKVCLSALLTVAIWFMVYGAETYALTKALPQGVLSAPLKSLTLFEQSSFQYSIGCFIALINGMRLISMLACAFIILLITSSATTVLKANLRAMGVLLLPAAAYYIFGGDVLCNLSVVEPIATVNTLLLSQGKWRDVLKSQWILIAIVLLLLGFRHYKKCNKSLFF